MKATGVDGLSRGDHTEGMMAGEDPMSFLPFHLGADARSRGRVGKWVRSWWRTSDQAQDPEQERDWGGLPLEEVNQDNMFELKNVKVARLWMLPPAAMEVAIKLLWEEAGAPPVASCVCRTSFHDPHVAERPCENRWLSFVRHSNLRMQRERVPMGW